VSGPRIRIAVLAGGRSSEHDISLASARSVLDVLDPTLYEVVPVLIEGDGRWRVLPSVAALPAAAGPPRAIARESEPATAVVANGFGSIDVVFPVLHGPFGEDGAVQGLLETLGIPYVGAGVLGSAVAMDKDVCKGVLRDKGIAVADSETLYDGDDDPSDPALADRLGARLGWPVFVKPASLGSSVGISKVRRPEELPAALALAFSHEPKVLVEEMVEGTELECGVLGNRELAASAVAEIRPNADWYDYSAKYDEGGSDIVIPAQISEADAARVRETALRAFRACGIEGMARVDFFLRPDGRLLVNEVNTIPGFTATSVYARLFEAGGVSYGELVHRLVQLAMERFEQRGRYRF
jgi:D-alanine-D-alanine ligase